MKLEITDEGFTLFIPDEEVREFIEMVENTSSTHFTRDLIEAVNKSKIRGLVP